MNPDLPTPTVGRTVLYVLPSVHPRAGEIRPATIVRVNPDTVNLSVHCDGPNDYMIVHYATRWVGSVPLDQKNQTPGTWHWMDDQISLVRIPHISEAPVMATASGGTDVHGD